MKASLRTAALALALVGTGCVILPVPLPVPVGAQSWRLSADYATLVTDGLRLECRRDGSLVATAGELMPVASNEEFSIGAGDEAVLLVAEVVGVSGPGVTAKGPISSDFLDALAAGGTLAAVYGPERIGPRQPPAGVVERFVPACRARLQAAG